MASIGKITLYEHWDAAKLAALIAAEETLYLEVERRYTLGELPETLTAVLPAQFGTTYMDYLIKTIDAATFVHEENCIVWVIKTAATGGMAFDLTGSYKRTGIDSVTGTEAVEDGVELLAIFTTAGLRGDARTAVVLPYGEAISGGDITALDDVGIELAASPEGSAFTVTSKTPFTVQFFQPSAAVENYVIDFDKNNQIIEP
jgi:hypothetical protein